jgi:hypothetical protein
MGNSLISTELNETDRFMEVSFRLESLLLESGSFRQLLLLGRVLAIAGEFEPMHIVKDIGYV